jgi:hypothetical protein
LFGASGIAARPGAELTELPPQFGSLFGTELARWRRLVAYLLSQHASQLRRIVR